jgi:hypothetical protein
MTEPDFMMHTDQLGPGSPDPAGNANADVDMIGLITAFLLTLFGETPALPVNDTSNPANAKALAALLGASLTIPAGLLPISSTSLVVPSAGVPSPGLGANGDLGINSQTAQVYSKASGAWTQNGLVYHGLLAATAPGGYTLPDSTGAILSWAAPDDGAQHRVCVRGQMLVTGAAETGGEINLTYTLPEGTAGTLSSVWASGLGTGKQSPTSAAIGGVICEPNTTVTLTQSVAQSNASSTALLFAELWGS